MQRPLLSNSALLLSHAAPLLSNSALLLSNAAPLLSHAAIVAIECSGVAFACSDRCYRM
jgi:hypothetical protein